MATWITVCDTCKRDGWDATTAGVTDGESLAEQVEAVSAELPETAGLRTRRVSCLMGCKRGCNIAIQAPGKIAYTLGEFTPDQDAAEAIAAFALQHAKSDTGQVPYRDWPQGVKGHFATRHPPLPQED